MSTVLRLLAVVLLLAALLPRTSTRHDRVLVVAVDGARLATIRQLVAEGEMPNVSALLAHAAGSELYGGSRRDARGFWRSALSGSARPGEPLHYVWDRAGEAGLRAAAIALPETHELVSPLALVLPGADEVTGFVGDNAGDVVSIASLKRADLEWPYDAAARRAEQEIAVLQPGGASNWIRVSLPGPDGRGGMFRIYRLDDDTAYLSPVYRAAAPARKYVPTAGDGLIYVPDDPAWTVDSSRLRDYFYRHARDLTGVRAELAADLAAGRWPLLVYFDPLLGLVDQAYPTERGETGAEDASVLRDAYRTIDTRVGSLVAAAGPRTAVVLLGREPASRKRMEKTAQDGPTATGFLFVGGASSGAAPVEAKPAHVTRVARTLLHLLGVQGSDGRLAIEAIVARYPGSRVPAHGGRARGGHEHGVPFTPDSLRQLGLLSESTRAPASENGDASAETSGVAATANRGDLGQD